MTELEQEIREFITTKVKKRLERFGLTDEAINDEFSLTESGVFDSIEFVELMTDVEHQFNVSVNFENYDPGEFTTLGGFSRCAAQG